MPMQTLEDAFLHELGDVLSAEKQMVRALPQMARAATDPRLREAFQQHLEETRNQVTRIEQVFNAVGRKPRAQKCDGMSGILQEGTNAIEEDAAPEVTDALLIGAAQKAEHYEIATYGTLCAWADLLGLEDAGKLLKQTLAEEKDADGKLNKSSENINEHAAEPEETEP
jgi:ferritin-like metal-binding protein YciE